MRFADLLLLCAEALNESKDAPDAEVYKYVDMVRERAGLKRSGGKLAEIFESG